MFLLLTTIPATLEILLTPFLSTTAHTVNTPFKFQVPAPPTPSISLRIAKSYQEVVTCFLASAVLSHEYYHLHPHTCFTRDK